MTERVFEMLWDCSSCGTNALLGKSQRRCPNCGAPQDPTKRYFPKPGEEVALDGHRFEGADWVCGACTTPNGAAAAFCQNCGNPKDGNQQVRFQPDRILQGGALVETANAAVGGASTKTASTTNAATKPKSKALLLIAAAIALVVVVVAVLLLWKKDVTVDVMAHTWKRAVDIERYEAVRESAWCDSMPGGAYNVHRSRERRSTRQIADGQTCHDRQVDRGDGTFVVKTECQTKYRSEPIYDDKCSFDVDRWHKVRDEIAQGGLLQQPAWPQPRLQLGSGRGAERTGARSERYTVQLRDAQSGKTHECDYDEAKWRSIADRSRHKIKVRLIGTAVCDSLQ